MIVLNVSVEPRCSGKDRQGLKFYSKYSKQLPKVDFAFSEISHPDRVTATTLGGTVVLHRDAARGFEELRVLEFRALCKASLVAAGKCSLDTAVKLVLGSDPVPLRGNRVLVLGPRGRRYRGDRAPYFNKYIWEYFPRKPKATPAACMHACMYA
jgi:hypothetical protein